MLILAFNSCRDKNKTAINLEGTDKNQELHFLNISKDQNYFPDKQVLMHNRKGIRVEYNITDQTLSLWISPQAGKSLDYRDRNFSNRDDHTAIFDHIYFPDLHETEFDSCDYDPFHSKLYFGTQVLNILSLYHEPVIIVWFDKPGKVDIKTDKEDVIIDQSKNFFFSDHPDRGLIFHFVAATGEGNGYFKHQPENDIRRSTYARAELDAGQSLVFAGELEYEQIFETARKFSDRSLELIKGMNSENVRKAIDQSNIKLKKHEELEQLIYFNKKILLSLQDESGAIRTSPKYIYYLLWNRDQALATSFTAQSGWLEPLRLNTRFLLFNPNRSIKKEPKGRFFGQLTGGPITKWEEDGFYYVLWAAYNYKILAGNDFFVSGFHYDLLTDALDWLEQYAYDKDLQLFGRYYYAETPLSYSRGDGWDHAMGRPSPTNIITSYDGDTIVRSYDIYINRLMASAYQMMASISPVYERDSFISKANVIIEKLGEINENNKDLPYSGILRTSTGELKTIRPFGMDTTDYILANSLPVYNLHLSPLDHAEQKTELLEAINSSSIKLSTYFSLLQSMDTEFIDEQLIMNAITSIMPKIKTAGEFLPMENALMESKMVSDGDIFKDIRPVSTSIGGFLASIYNLGVKKLPNGIALRGNNVIESIKDFQYLNSLVTFNWIGQGEIESIYIGNKPLEHTWQIPENEIYLPKTRINIEMSEHPVKKEILVSSNTRLKQVEVENHEIIYTIACPSGRNQLIFKNVNPRNFLVKNAEGQIIDINVNREKGYLVVNFEGTGIFQAFILK